MNAYGPFYSPATFTREGETQREAARRRTLARIRSLREQADRLQAILDGKIK